LKTLFAVDGGVDLAIRKYKPILLRLILQTFHFTEFEEGGCFLYGGGVCRFASRLKGLQHSEILLDGAVQALLVEGEELQSFGFSGEDAGGGEGGVDLFVIGAELAAVFV